MKNSFKEFLKQEEVKEYYKELIGKIKVEEKKNNIFPPESLRFEALNYFEVEETKLIIIGQDPYYLKGQADGLAFSTQSDKCPKSLQNILKELKKDYPETIIETFSLKSWVKQGVLLINTCLSVNENSPLSHKNFGWEIFVINLIKQILSKNKNVIFGIWGNDAKKVLEIVQKDYKIDEKQIIITSHPSPLAYSKTSNSFKDSKFFKRVNSQLTNPINWDLRKD
ncbi:uracil-DNA glycosylase [Mycoplasmopsis caviae]|uniref:Uracil-DNA glycosylase n=1 Tax=Mycoplasmopsis caviae TaxID=55603 RepID=A0A3P8KBS0_9BACT|nr:uracil-DNA glycosylase [Mycoplasmopsis caviae]UUD35145.1 uracil-DNA glycosylase [Mycoplasmopsis caviae]VDR42044.1 uracil-DNA glycosylase [Mycoplasmopsis caviae]